MMKINNEKFLIMMNLFMIEKYFFFPLQLISVKTVPMEILLLTEFLWEDMDHPCKYVTRTL